MTPEGQSDLHDLRAKKGKSNIALVVAIVLIAGALGALLFVRIRGALADRKAIAQQNQAALETSQRDAAGPTKIGKIAHPVPTDWAPMLSFDGTLNPIADVDLAFKASGPIAVLRVKVGDFVQKGDVLASLDSSEAVAQASAALAQQRAAAASLALAKDNQNRTTDLVKSGAMAEANQTQVEGQSSLVQAQYEAAGAQANLASASVRNHTLFAPFSGFITTAPRAVGGFVGAGVPVFHIKDVSRLRLVGSVAANDFPLVKVGEDVLLSTPSGTAKGKVSAVIPSVDPSTRRAPVEAEFDSNPALVAGTFVSTNIAGGGKISVLSVPATVLRPGSQDEVVLLTGDHLTLRKISFVRDSNGNLLVRDGLSATDVVVDAPKAEAKDGEPATLIEGAK
jgi:RND family efflux transporter MFP subunit